MSKVFSQHELQPQLKVASGAAITDLSGLTE